MIICVPAADPQGRGEAPVEGQDDAAKAPLRSTIQTHRSPLMVPLPLARP